MFRIVILLVLFLLIPNPVEAHGVGMPPFATIDGKFVKTYPLFSAGVTSSTIPIPQDSAPENYIVNQPVRFAIDKTQIKSVITDDYLKRTKFSWDFGDGQKGEGMEQTHTYTKVGTFIVTLTINITVSPGDPPTQIVDSYLMQIVPNTGFTKLPQAKMMVNSQIVDTQFAKVMDVNYDNPVIFDASNAVSSGTIQLYAWDFGDGITDHGQHVEHTFVDKLPHAIMLRISDSQGYFSDSFVIAKYNQNPVIIPTIITEQNKTKPLQKQNDMIIPFILMPFIIGTIIYIKRKQQG